MRQAAGHSRSRTDFHTDAQNPKLLWLYPLKSEAHELLVGPGELPAAHAAGIKDGVAGARCPGSGAIKFAAAAFLSEHCCLHRLWLDSKRARTRNRPR